MHPKHGLPSSHANTLNPPTQRNQPRQPLALISLVFIVAIVTTYFIASQGVIDTTTECRCSSNRAAEGGTVVPLGSKVNKQEGAGEAPPLTHAVNGGAVGNDVEVIQQQRSLISDKLTVVLMSYPGSKRFHLLEKIIRRALEWEFVHEILLVWNGDAQLVPAEIKAFASHIEDSRLGNEEEGLGTKMPLSSPSLTILPQLLNRVDNRWRIGNRVRTEAILNMDDDINLRTNGAQCLFDVWRASPDALVCLDVRSHFVHKEKSGKDEGPFGPLGYAARDTSTKGVKKFSIALPRSLLTTRKHLLAYDEAFRDPKTQVKRIVDELLCDDIAFNFVANRGHSLPLTIYAKANYDSYPESNSEGAMVKEPGMKDKRQRCVNELASALNLTLKHRYWHVVCSVDG